MIIEKNIFDVSVNHCDHYHFYSESTKLPLIYGTITLKTEINKIKQKIMENYYWYY